MKDDSWKHNGSNDYMNKFLVCMVLLFFGWVGYEQCYFCVLYYRHNQKQREVNYDSSNYKKCK